MDTNSEKCSHEWKPSGLWDGKTPDGKRTGGVMYVCTKCGERATEWKIQKIGGVMLDGLDVFGRPVKE